MWVCVYICVYVYIWYMYVNIYIHNNIIHIYIYIYIFVWMYMYKCLCLYYIYIYINIYIYIIIYIIYIYIYIYIYKVVIKHIFKYVSTSSLYQFTLYITTQFTVYIYLHILLFNGKKRQHFFKNVWAYSFLHLHIGRSTLIGQRPMKSLSSVYPSVCPSVTNFSQNWIISFFWYCTWW